MSRASRWQAASIVLTALVLVCIAPPGVAPGQVKDRAGKDGTRASFGPPILLEGSQSVVVPFGADADFIAGKLSTGPAYFISDTLSVGVGSPTPLASPLSLGSCFDTGPVHWNNAFFYDVESHQSHLLLNRRAVICRFYVPRSEPPHAPAYLLFAVANADTNGDGTIDEKDAVTLYVTDPAGRSLAPLTPPNSRVDSVTFNSTGDTVYAQITTDPDNTRKFDGGNPIMVLRIDPIHPSVGSPIWPEDLRQQALNLAAP